MLLSLLGVVGALRWPAIVAAVACLGAICFVGDLLGWIHLLGSERARFIYMFFCGAWFFIVRERVPMSGFIAAGCVMALAAVAIMTRNHNVHRLVLGSVVPFLTLWMGFAPNGIIRQFNRLGDYSYGVYILACPVQYYLVWRHQDLAPWSLFCLTMSIVVPLSIISWRYVESRALHVPLPLRLRATSS